MPCSGSLRSWLAAQAVKPAERADILGCDVAELLEGRGVLEPHDSFLERPVLAWRGRLGKADRLELDDGHALPRVRSNLKRGHTAPCRERKDIKRMAFGRLSGQQRFQSGLPAWAHDGSTDRPRRARAAHPRISPVFSLAWKNKVREPEDQKRSVS